MNNIVIIILILLFSYIIISNLFNKKTFRESMSNQDDILKTIGENKANIKNLESVFSKTLKRAKELYGKLEGAKNQSSMNADAQSHPSIKTLNLKPKKTTDDCENMQTMSENTYSELNEKHMSNIINFSTLDVFIEQINDQIKKIKNKL